MRLPNGYGSVYKLSGNRRKPWIARKTIECHIEEIDGKKTHRQHYVTVGYYAEPTEALQALADYNSNPYDINAAKVTFKELYEKWSEKKYEKISAPNGYKAAFALSESLHSMPFAEIKSDPMQDVIDTCGKGYATRKNIKILYNQLFSYAMERDIITKDYSKYVSMGKNDKNSTRKPFTQKEIDKLWSKVDKFQHTDTILIMIYSGWRPGEFITLENSKIDLAERTMIGGIKTEAGKNRVVPINKKILPLIEKRMSQNECLLNDDGKNVSYDRYRDWFSVLMEQLKMDHKPHDCRHTFATLMDNSGANKLSIKRIMGHATPDVTDGYTHKDIEELIKAIDLI
jgi:integrase